MPETPAASRISLSARRPAPPRARGRERRLPGAAPRAEPSRRPRPAPSAGQEKSERDEHDVAGEEDEPRFGQHEQHAPLHTTLEAPTPSWRTRDGVRPRLALFPA